MMSDAVTGAGLPGEGGGNIVVFHPDYYSGFNAKVEEYNYKFLGDRTTLGVVNAAHSPEVTLRTGRRRQCVSRELGVAPDARSRSGSAQC